MSSRETAKLRIVLLSAGARAAWLRSAVAGMRGPDGVAFDVVGIEGAATRERLVELPGAPTDVLVLVDHRPFLGAPLKAKPVAEAVREEAMCGMLALEASRRVGRTLHLSGEAGPWLAELASLVGIRPPARPPARPPSPPKAPAGLAALPIVAAYLEPIHAAVSAEAPLQLTWPRECFLDGDAPGKPLPATVEVAGRARILAYGPYLPLPAGRWKATACLGFSPDIGKMPFILEIDTGAAVTRGFFEVERGGIYTLELDVRVVDSFHPIELRLISQESSLEGQVALIEVVLRQSLEGS